MLGAKTETSRRGAAARFIGSRNLVDNALSLIVSQGYQKSYISRLERMQENDVQA